MFSRTRVNMERNFSCQNRSRKKTILKLFYVEVLSDGVYIMLHFNMKIQILKQLALGFVTRLPYLVNIPVFKVKEANIDVDLCLDTKRNKSC